MIPAVVWAASASSAHSFAQVIGGFPFYYLAVSQLLVLPRYIISAIVVDKLGTSKYFSVKWGIIGMLAAGLVVDVQLTTMFAHAIADPQHGRPFVIPLLALPLGLASMLFTAIVSGYAAQGRSPKPSSHRKGK
ncbi:MAG: hypothetical protein ABWY71_01350 [Candidatus Saccharimonadales bacterium]